MVVLTASACSTYRLVIRSEAHSVEEDPSPTLPSRIVLPKKKPVKWSTGVAPGEYGGPPTTTKLRKYWGGGDEDPVTATDDFIWNKEFLGRMQQLLDGDQSNPNSVPSLNKEPDSGFLSLNRSMSLDSMEVDLSKELMPPPKPVLEQQVEAARRGLSFTEINNDASSPRWRFVPTRREQAKWDRATKAATGGSLKQKLQILTASIGGIGVVSAYFTYTPEIAVSFGAGLIGSLAYIRMLGNTVDSMANGAKGLMKGAVGQPRLLVPVILVMMFNRWNEVLVPDYGFIHLELIPMLLGFFTYKVATFAQALQEAIDTVNRKS